ncbi:hypothetical protein M422DRAFT_783741 [Sphaerobolus stellatus SS14]|uniref:Uncharacterized protein n=1 Tax=Sphaerobolus stellatus (strain SS14) TaxID=990650 RepID=A0A0C9TNH3_SPHS4|nr:hypothetical protein M422DRAFT_783741 [Sphaerobolus stellatus SS14]
MPASLLPQPLRPVPQPLPSSTPTIPSPPALPTSQPQPPSPSILATPSNSPSAPTLVPQVAPTINQIANQPSSANTVIPVPTLIGGLAPPRISSSTPTVSGTAISIENSQTIDGALSGAQALGTPNTAGLSIPTSSPTMTTKSSVSQPTPISLSNALPPLIAGFEDVFISVDQFNFEPADAWELSNSTICNKFTNGQPGQRTQLDGASFSFTVPGDTTDIFLLTPSGPLEGILNIQVNNQSEQVVNLYAPTETCDVAPLNLGTGLTLTQMKRAIAGRIYIRDIGKEFVAITAKVEKAPVEVDGAILLCIPGNLPTSNLRLRIQPLSKSDIKTRRQKSPPTLPKHKIKKTQLGMLLFSTLATRRLPTLTSIHLSSLQHPLHLMRRMTGRSTVHATLSCRSRPDAPRLYLRSLGRGGVDLCVVKLMSRCVSPYLPRPSHNLFHAEILILREKISTTLPLFLDDLPNLKYISFIKSLYKQDDPKSHLPSAFPARTIFLEYAYEKTESSKISTSFNIPTLSDYNGNNPSLHLISAILSPTHIGSETFLASKFAHLSRLDLFFTKYRILRWLSRGSSRAELIRGINAILAANVNISGIQHFSLYTYHESTFLFVPLSKTYKEST